MFKGLLDYPPAECDAKIEEIEKSSDYNRLGLDRSKVPTEGELNSVKMTKIHPILKLFDDTKSSVSREEVEKRRDAVTLRIKGVVCLSDLTTRIG